MRISSEMTAALVGMKYNAFKQQLHLGAFGRLGVVEGERDRLFGLTDFALLRLHAALRNEQRTVAGAFETAGRFFEPLVAILTGLKPVDPPTYAVLVTSAGGEDGFTCDGPDQLSEAVSQATVAGAQTANPVELTVANLSALADELMAAWAVAIGHGGDIRRRIMAADMAPEDRERALAVVERAEKAIAGTKRKIRVGPAAAYTFSASPAPLPLPAKHPAKVTSK
jgi:hypothetical protein